MTSDAPLLQSDLDLPLRFRGKVRDVYDLPPDEHGERLLLVATDRISAYDCILPFGIPGKGRILASLSAWWFRFLEPKVEHHLISDRREDMPAEVAARWPEYAGRTQVVRRVQVLPFECVVRGRLAGSAVDEYRKHGTVAGMPLPAGLMPGDPLPEPLFTPATKAASGHDENVTWEHMARCLGRDLAAGLRDRSLEVFRCAEEHLRSRGLVLCDTKMEWGQVEGRAVLADELLTPDSSRYWPQDGGPGDALDKQYIRDGLRGLGFTGEGEPPALPGSMLREAARRYEDAYTRITGRDPA